ncbi:hypothetical protein H7S55_14755 [Priestia aryabhattai]|uniref:hypothetical protein n=1 Tax=Priestia aryabhattai TaxID=412384 RepID=UPI001C8E7C8A|nr:hypothetical protein [Priestia aryabhattai]MBY0001436.1 hypothetical protein [Priestia aryabhattai]
MLQAVTLKGEQFINLPPLSTSKQEGDDSKISRRSKDRALLMIYPIKTENLDDTERYNVITFAIAFPFSNAVPEETTTYIGSTTIVDS